MYDNRFTPKAQNTLRLAQAAAEGSGRALAVLAGEGAALFALGLPRRR